MIEKLKETQTESQRYKIVRKLNEVIEVVNVLIKENNIHEKQIDSLQIDIRPILEERKSEIKIYEEIIQSIKKDPYAEQRKWIGKLCWFWDNEDEKDGFINKWYGTLDNIDPHCKCGAYCMGLGHYEHCEPVKPDDNIIYKEQ